MGDVFATSMLGEKRDLRQGVRLVNIGSSWTRVSFRLYVLLCFFGKNVEKALGFSNL